MTVVCLPDERAYQLVGDVPGVRTLLWDGSVAPPPGIASTEFLVGSYTRGPLAVDQFSLMPRLRVVQVLSAGVDAWLDVVPPGVALCNGRGVHGLSTAELAVALVLAQLRDIPRYARQQAGEVWLSGERESLCDKRVLIVGAGDIGGHVKEVLNALGATVTLVGRSARAGIAGFAQLPALLPDQDVVVLAVPLTEQTRGLVDEGFLARMKDQAILVNVGRGPTVGTSASRPRRDRPGATTTRTPAVACPQSIADPTRRWRKQRLGQAWLSTRPRSVGAIHVRAATGEHGRRSEIVTTSASLPAASARSSSTSGGPPVGAASP
jgi:hypothetical protein